jgi:hypothetical protein
MACTPLTVTFQWATQKNQAPFDIIEGQNDTRQT